MTICAALRDIIASNLKDILARRRDRHTKMDGSYVTAADIFIQDLLIDYLSDAFPGSIVISEELALPSQFLTEASRYVIVDPLDGTENFVSGLKEWGVGVSLYEYGRHRESMILLPELGESLITGETLQRFDSRIHGISSSLKKSDLEGLEEAYEYRLMGCAMYNMFNVIRGSYRVFENIKGVNAWDVLPGLNLALEHGCLTTVNGEPYHGQLLWPDSKYRVKVSHR